MTINDYYLNTLHYITFIWLEYKTLKKSVTCDMFITVVTMILTFSNNAMYQFKTAWHSVQNMSLKLIFLELMSSSG